MPAKEDKAPIFPKIDRRYMWMGLGIITLLINALFRANPYFTEVVYSRGIFLVIRWIWDYSLGLVPIPLLYIFVPLLLFYFIRRWRRGKPHRKARPVINRWGSMLVSVLGLAGITLFLFYFLWGYNYQRLPVAQQLKLPVSELSDEEVQKEYHRVTQLLVDAQAILHPFSDTAFLDREALQGLESKSRNLLKHQLQKYNYPVPGRPRAFAFRPQGLLMQLGASGIYIPFVAQGHVDAAQTPVSQPSTMTHELAHAYGFGDEGTCNFWAFLACTESDDPLIRYSGYMSYWRHVASLYKSRFPEDFEEERKKLPAGIVEDLKKIYEVNARYPGFFPSFSRAFYERYLKAQGIEEGRKSYSKVVSYVVAFQKRPTDIP